MESILAGAIVEAYFYERVVVCVQKSIGPCAKRLEHVQHSEVTSAKTVPHAFERKDTAFPLGKSSDA